MACATLAAALAGCAGEDEAGDGRDDDFLADGKADTGGISEDDARAAAVLRVVNEAEVEALDVDAGLDSRAAEGIAAHRAGADGQLGTGDDDLFDSLAELDAVPYVGRRAFAKLLAYATELGYVAYDWRTELSWPTYRPDKPSFCTITAPPDATSLRFLVEATSGRWRMDIRDADYNIVQQIRPPFQGWTEVIDGRAATYQIYDGADYLDCYQFRGLSQAREYHIPVATDDPYGCTVRDAWSRLSADSIEEGVVARASTPEPTYFSDGGSCNSDTGVSLLFTPPTDGEYLFTTLEHTVVSVRDSCAAETLSCDGSGARHKLTGGVPVVVGLNDYQSWTFVEISRPRAEWTCDDGFDQDGDGAVDCDDSDCARACRTPEVCDNGVDDNDDGLIDCFDRDCSGAAECSQNQCPGEDLGSATAPQGTPVAAGNGSLAPEDTYLSCRALEFPGSRYLHWQAPSTGSYRFRVNRDGTYDYGLRILDGGCEADELACSVGSAGGGWLDRIVLDLQAGQELVLEVGATPASYASSSTWTLEIVPQ